MPRRRPSNVTMPSPLSPASQPRELRPPSAASGRSSRHQLHRPSSAASRASDVDSSVNGRHPPSSSAEWNIEVIPPVSTPLLCILPAIHRLFSLGPPPPLSPPLRDQSLICCPPMLYLLTYLQPSRLLPQFRRYPTRHLWDVIPPWVYCQMSNPAAYLTSTIFLLVFNPSALSHL